MARLADADGMLLCRSAVKQICRRHHATFRCWPAAQNVYDRALLPRSLMDAVRALKTSALFREKMGSDFIDYIVALKEFEISRFLSHVTDWEHREYFEMF
jgi:glutamine synthetase